MQPRQPRPLVRWSPRSGVRWFPRLALLCLLPACGTDRGESIGGGTDHLVYGPDDRKELFEVKSPEPRKRLSQAVVAFIPAANIDDTGNVEAAPLRDVADFCSPQRFEEQLSAAFCTGVLVDRDLVLTAGHCVRVLSLPDTRVVFGFYYGEPERLAVDRSSIYGVTEIVAERLDPRGASPRIDYAWVRLSHPADASRQPLPLALGPPDVGQTFTVAAASFGLPLKVDESATVYDVRSATEDFFLAASDTSHGASGAPALDGRGAILGVLARGGSDERVTMEGCTEPLHVETPEGAQEQFTYAARALDGLCDANPSSSLCRRPCYDPCGALPPPHQANAGCSMTRSAPHRRLGLPVTISAIVVLLARRRWQKSSVTRRQGGRAR